MVGGDAYYAAASWLNGIILVRKAVEGDKLLRVGERGVEVLVEPGRPVEEAAAAHGVVVARRGRTGLVSPVL